VEQYNYLPKSIVARGAIAVRKSKISFRRIAEEVPRSGSDRPDQQALSYFSTWLNVI
jgi:hypothetical protein